MTSYYSVVRFVPSALAEEFINIGVLTFGDGIVRGKFLDDWGRVERFADPRKLANAQAFQDWVLESMLPEGPSDRRLRPMSEETLKRIASQWGGSVQLSEPRGSLLEPDALLEDIATTFLIEPPPSQLPVGTRRPSEKVALRHLAKDALARAFATAGHDFQVKTRSPLSAAVRPRVFDVVVANGSPRCAAECFNFSVANPKSVLERLDAAAFAIEDARKKNRQLQAGFVSSLPDDDAQEAYAQAEATCAQVGIEFVPESRIPAWSEEVAAAVLLGL